MSDRPTLTHEAIINELGRRLAAAYVSQWAGYSGVDYLLKGERMPEKPGKFWLELAEFVYQAQTSTGRFSKYSDMPSVYFDPSLADSTVSHSNESR